MAVRTGTHGFLQTMVSKHKFNDLRHTEDAAVVTEINIANQENNEDIEDEEESEDEQEKEEEENSEETETRNPTIAETEVAEIEVSDREETIEPIISELAVETSTNEIKELNNRQSGESGATYGSTTD
jgi:hypothetical protein